MRATTVAIFGVAAAAAIVVAILARIDEQPKIAPADVARPSVDAPAVVAPKPERIDARAVESERAGSVNPVGPKPALRTRESRSRNEPARGRVFDAETEQPVADVAIVKWRRHGTGRPREVARTDADGWFELSAPTLRQCPLGVMAEKPGFIGSDCSAAELGFDGAVVLYLRRECVIEGRVVTSDGRPVAGAVIAMRSVPEMRHYEATTNDAGEYRIGGLGGRAFGIGLEWEEVALHHDPIGFSGPGDRQRLDWRVPNEWGDIGGRVTVNGARVDAKVRWANRPHVAPAAISLDEFGAFHFERVPAGDVVVSVDLGQGFETLTAAVRVAPGARASCTVDLAIELHRICGTVEYAESSKGIDWYGLPGGARSDDGARLDPAGIRLIATRTRDAFALHTAVQSDGSFAFVLPESSWDEWRIEVDPASVDITPISARISAKTTHSGATNVAMSIFRDRGN